MTLSESTVQAKCILLDYLIPFNLNNLFSNKVHTSFTYILRRRIKSILSSVSWMDNQCPASPQYNAGSCWSCHVAVPLVTIIILHCINLRYTYSFLLKPKSWRNIPNKGYSEFRKFTAFLTETREDNIAQYLAKDC